MRKTAAIRTWFPYGALDPLASLAKAIVEYQPHLVVPGDDRAVEHLHELHATGPKAFGMDCAELIERSLGAPASYPVVSSRFPLLEIAREERLRIPKTSVIRSLEDLDSLRPEPAAPWVLKSDGTWGGHGVAIARDAREARRLFLALAQPVGRGRALKRLLVDREAFSLRPSHKEPHDVVAQEFIPGVPANSGFFCWEGNVLADIHVKVLHSQGSTGAATVVRVIDHPEMALAAKQLARRLGLSGFFGLDFMIEEGSGAAYLLELNPRCTPLCHLQFGEGRDMVGALNAQLKGERFEETPPVTLHDTIIYFPQAWHWDHSIAGRPSSFHDVPWEDPALIQELMLLPWPDRGVLARLYNRLRHTTFAERAAHGDGTYDEPEAADSNAPPDQTPGSLEHLPSVVPLRREGSKDPLFLIHGVDGKLECFHALTKRLDANQPVYGVLAQALLGEKTVFTRVEEMAEYYVKAVQAVQPRGPYHLVGRSFGGYVAFEMARLLQARGERVGLLGLIDTHPMSPAQPPWGPERGEGLQRALPAADVPPFFSEAGLANLRSKFGARCLRILYTLLEAVNLPIPSGLRHAYDINWFAVVRYVPQPYTGRVTFFQASDSSDTARSEQSHRLAGDGVEIRDVPGNHETLLAEPQVQLLAKEIMDCLAKSECGSAQVLPR